MSNYIDLTVILSDSKLLKENFVSAIVAKNAIIAIQEDPDNNKRSYILLQSGHDMYVDLDYTTLRNLVKE